MIPTLYTPRLVLRPFTLADAARVQELLSDPRVAKTTGRVPHPYPEGAAEAWLEESRQTIDKNRLLSFAITLAGTRTPNREQDLTDTGHLIGSIGLGLRPNTTPEIGYWVGHNYWNKGFATEAANAVIQFAFSKLDLAQISSAHFAQNPASGAVLKKLGMTQQQITSEYFPIRDETFEVIHYALTREQWSRRQFVHRWKPLRPTRTLATV